MQARAKVEAGTVAWKKTINYNARVTAAIAKAVADAAASGKQAELAKLRDLIALNESLKLQEAQFKSSCARQRAALKETEASLRAIEGSEEAQRLAEIERRHAEILKQYSRLKVCVCVRVCVCANASCVCV